MNNGCKTCKSYGYIKTGNDSKPYIVCPDCKGEGFEGEE